MKLSFDFKSLSLSNILKKNLSLILAILLGFIAILTGLVMYREVRKVSQVQIDNAGVLDRIVRLNLGMHRSLETQLGENSSFEPMPIPGAEVFGITPPSTE